MTGHMFEALTPTGPVVLIRAGKNRLESSDDRRVELSFDRLGESQACDSTRHCIAVRAIGCHRVICISDSNDAREEGNLIAIHAVWVALPIDSLVVVPHHRCNLGVGIDLRENPLADFGVLLHLPTLIECQGARLLEEASRETDLSDVVHETTKLRKFALCVVEPHAFGDVRGVNSDSR